MADTTVLANVKLELDINDTEHDALLSYYIDKYTLVAQNITHYDILPAELNPYVVSSVVESYNRRGHEGESSNSVIGVSSSFAFKDIEDGLINKLKNHRNPLSLVGLRKLDGN